MRWKKTKGALLVGFLVLAAAAVVMPTGGTIYFTSTNPPTGGRDEWCLVITAGAQWAISQVQVWDGTAPEPSGAAWDDDENEHIVEFPQTANDPPGAGEYINNSTGSTNRLHFGENISEDCLVRICIDYPNQPPPDIEECQRAWSNH